jgi:hypothetical protein
MSICRPTTASHSGSSTVAEARVNSGLPSDEEQLEPKRKAPLMQLARAGKVIKVKRT